MSGLPRLPERLRCAARLIVDCRGAFGRQALGGPHVIAAWLGRICSAEHPPESVTAYNIGLFEAKKGYTAYLIGADRYDAADSDWACRESFTPKERYQPLPAGEFKGWDQAHAAVVEAVRGFLGSPLGRESFLGQAVTVTVGFDDGELQRVK